MSNGTDEKLITLRRSFIGNDWQNVRQSHIESISAFISLIDLDCYSRIPLWYLQDCNVIFHCHACCYEIMTLMPICRAVLLGVSTANKFCFIEFLLHSSAKELQNDFIKFTCTSGSRSHEPDQRWADPGGPDSDSILAFWLRFQLHFTIIAWFRFQLFWFRFRFHNVKWYPVVMDWFRSAQFRLQFRFITLISISTPILVVKKVKFGQIWSQFGFLLQFLSRNCPSLNQVKWNLSWLFQKWFMAQSAPVILYALFCKRKTTSNYVGCLLQMSWQHIVLL